MTLHEICASFIVLGMFEVNSDWIEFKATKKLTIGRRVPVMNWL